MPWPAVSVVQAELGVCLQLSRWMVIMGPRLGQRTVPSECSEVEGALEGGQEGCALEGEGLGRGGAAALLQSLPPLPPAGGPAAPPWPLAPRWLSECPQGRRGEGSGPGRATVALLCRREQVGPWNLSCQV